MKIILCPYCNSSHTILKCSTINAIYRTDEHGHPISLPEDTTNYYYCMECHKNFTVGGGSQYKDPISRKDFTLGELAENSTDQKLNKIIDLLEQLIAKL